MRVLPALLLSSLAATAFGQVHTAQSPTGNAPDKESGTAASQGHEFADPREAIRWNWRLVPADAKPGSEAELVLEATLAPHWILYPSRPGAPGPLPAKLKADKGATLELLEPLRSVGTSRKHDSAWNAELEYFAGRAELRQRVRVPADGALAAVLSAQACHETEGTCHLIREQIRIAAR